jgi:hypothetical protein
VTFRVPRWLLGSLLVAIAVCTFTLGHEHHWILFGLWFTWFILMYRYRMGEWPG